MVSALKSIIIALVEGVHPAYQLTSAASQTILKIYWLATTRTASHDILWVGRVFLLSAWPSRGCPATSRSGWACAIPAEGCCGWCLLLQGCHPVEGLQGL